jgi:hypothetical protein
VPSPLVKSLEQGERKMENNQKSRAEGRRKTDPPWHMNSGKKGKTNQNIFHQEEEEEEEEEEERKKGTKTNVVLLDEESSPCNRTLSLQSARSNSKTVPKSPKACQRGKKAYTYTESSKVFCSLWSDVREQFEDRTANVFS